MSALRRLLSRCLGWLVAVIGFLGGLPIASATLFMYFFELPWPEGRLALAAAFAAFVIWAFWLSRRLNMSAALSCCFSASWGGGSPSLPRTIATGGRKSR